MSKKIYDLYMEQIIEDLKTDMNDSIIKKILMVL